MIGKKTMKSFFGSSDKAGNDMIFVMILLVIISVFALVLFVTRTGGDTVRVLVDGEIYGEYPLFVDMKTEIKSENGYNILEIKDGKADVLSASCPDGICVSHRPIENGGESIICLPNKVVVEIHTLKESEKDIVA